MVNWKNACTGDKKRLQAISTVLAKYPWFIDEIFHPTEPSLKTSPQALLRGRSSGEKVLIGTAVDLWNAGANVKLIDLEHLDNENLMNVFKALALLRAPYQEGEPNGKRIS